MGDSQNEIIEFYKKRIEPFMAIFIIALIITGLILLYQDNQLKKEISKSCGYETKKYVCYCEKSDVDAFREEQEKLSNGGYRLDVPLAG